MKKALVFNDEWELISLIKIEDEELLKDKVELLRFLRKETPNDLIWAIYIVDGSIESINQKEIQELFDDLRRRKEK